MTQREGTPAGLAPRAVLAAALGLVLAAMLWEGASAVLAPLLVAREADWQGAAAVVRGGFQQGDLIVFAPRWADQVGRQYLGDLMPIQMVGRPDGRRYGRIWEVAIRGERAAETQGLSPELSARRGRVLVARYRQQAAVVTYDLVEQYLGAHVTQAPQVVLGREAPSAQETPCLWVGPLPAPPSGAPVRSEAGAFLCRGGRVERRTMEIDYQPRYGVVVPAEQGQQTIIEFGDIPAAAWTGARLWLWFGLHDYYARKTESGPVDVVVELGGSLVPVRVQPDRGWQAVQVAPPPEALERLSHPSASGHDVPTGRAVDVPAEPITLRLRVSAKDARARYLGFAGEVRR